MEGMCVTGDREKRAGVCVCVGEEKELVLGFSENETTKKWVKDNNIKTHKHGFPLSYVCTCLLGVDTEKKTKNTRLVPSRSPIRIVIITHSTRIHILTDVPLQGEEKRWRLLPRSGGSARGRELMNARARATLDMKSTTQPLIMHEHACITW